jgi:hypothetical protein
MGIDMIAAALRIVFEDENSGIVPVLRMADIVDRPMT